VLELEVMPTLQPLPFGSWQSPVTADLIASANIRLGQIALRGPDIFWSEGRPQEQGRNVLVHRRGDGSITDVNPAPLDVRTRVHEYGGGAFVLLPDGGSSATSATSSCTARATVLCHSN
jgi:hypothetical protein